jgi:TPR repeat protein
MCLLGDLYRHGSFVTKDLSKAREIYRKAIRMKSVRGWFCMGYTYREEKNHKKEFQCYLNAVRKNYLSGLLNIVSMYVYDIFNDLDEAMRIITSIEHLSHPRIVIIKGEIYEKQNKFEEALTCYKKSQERTSLYRVGYMYERGRGVEKNIHDAIQWYTKAANLDHAQARRSLGCIYEKQNNYDQAIYWYNKAIEVNDHLSLVFLGNLYEQGHGVEHDFTKAFTLYQKAVEKGYHGAKCDLAHLFINGLGVEKNLDKALELVRSAIDHGVNAFSILGFIYETQPSYRDYLEALKCYKKSNQNNAFTSLNSILVEKNYTIEVEDSSSFHEDNQCDICLDNKAVVKSLPCNHRWLCYRCSFMFEKESKCGLCRQFITQLINE